MPIMVMAHDVPNQILAVVTGEVGVPELLEFAAVERVGERRGWALIFDTSGAVLNVSSADVRRLAQLPNQGPTLGPLVIIAPKAAMFGISRMYQSYAEMSGRTNIGVFSSMAEAQRWLDEPGRVERS